MAAGSSHHLNTGNEGLGQVLGDLEAEIMECMWDLGYASVRRVHECLQEDRNIAYTTVMTVMTRLAEKGLLDRMQEGRAYIYSPVQSRDAFCTGVIKNVMTGCWVRQVGLSWHILWKTWMVKMRRNLIFWLRLLIARDGRPENRRSDSLTDFWIACQRTISDTKTPGRTC